MRSAPLLLALLLTTSQFQVARAETHFLEAENFETTSDGWKVVENPQTRGASRIKALNGSTGAAEGTASARIAVRSAAHYRIWVRHNYHSRWRGPFTVTVSHGGRTIGEKTFDLAPRENVKDWSYVWDSFDVPLVPGGFQTFTLTKHEGKNCSGYVRNVDCLLVTSDQELTPDHSAYGPQTWMRVTLGDIYEKPLQVHIFADHYRAPWYGHWHLSKAGAQSGLSPAKGDLLESGEQTPWCNVSPMIYQDSGAILNLTARYSYGERADRFKARIDIATALDEKAIVKTFDVDSQPNGLVLVMPPNLLTEENRQWLKRDREFAEATGRIADAHDWPTFGRKPTRIPFFVSATVGGYGTPVDQAVMDREWMTLDYFGFSNRDRPFLHGGIWLRRENSYCRPDLEKMRAKAGAEAEEFLAAGKKLEDIAFCMLTDEPQGQPSTFLAEDEAYHEAFRAWLKELGKAPADLLVDDWEAVKPVPESQRDAFPGLHYFTQRFRTRALGDFMATQREILEEAYGATFPTLVNFSDGATYSANFYGQGVDYFELLDSDDQNAIWSEDWANGSSSYQCAAYNVDLMRAAARERGQVLGHYLVAHAHRKPWDILTKAAAETARGVRLWKNFSYGVSWGSHEGGPMWRSHTWYNDPEKWSACAEVVREIGGAEDLLADAKARPADVAILYSSASDAWTMKRNHATGFNRMHTWMALAHAQVPVDFLGERQVERDALDSYRVCYFSGPNLTRKAATKLAAWVESGGTLVLSAGAAMRDEFNRPLDTVERLLPARRGSLIEHQAFLNSGRYVHILRSAGTVNLPNHELEILALSQSLEPKPDRDTAVLAKAADGTPALVTGKVGDGRIEVAGFVPALAYIKEAVVARRTLETEREEKPAAEQGDHPAPPVEGPASQTPERVDLDPRLERSYNPWEYSAEVRDLILRPVREAGVSPPLTCEVPLVDAVVLDTERGLVIPLANFTLEPRDRVSFTLRTDREIARIESVRHGELAVEKEEDGLVGFALPLAASDYVKVYFQDPLKKTSPPASDGRARPAGR